MTKDSFLEHAPKWMLATNDVRRPSWMRPAEKALSFSHISPNSDRLKKWLLFDLDRDDSYFVAEERDLPEPHFISVNRANGHAHLGYLIEGVSTTEASRQKPLRLMRDVELGITHRLGADFGYSKRLCKNPFHPQWETDWQAKSPYDLGRLADFLTKDEKRGSKSIVIGVGRNCTLFDRLRKIAYREVLDFKVENRSPEDFRSVMEADALHMNARFANPLLQSEVKGIVKSVSRWVWREFSVEGFSKRQSQRANLRWQKPRYSVEIDQPWVRDGVSRRTWYRRKKASQCPIP